jgi:hypothetical protein
LNADEKLLCCAKETGTMDKLPILVFDLGFGYSLPVDGMLLPKGSST